MKRFTLLFALAMVAGILMFMAPKAAMADTMQSPLTLLQTLPPTLMVEAPADATTSEPGVQKSSWGAIKSLYLGKTANPNSASNPSASRGLKGGAGATYATYPQCYTWRFPFCGSWSITCKYGCNRHTGMDYYAIDWSLPGEKDFNSPVLAPASGWVVWSGYKGDYGNQVIVDTGNNVLYRVAHLNWLRFSNNRQYVYQGQTLGGAGRTGAADGTHIHFVTYRGSYVGNGTVSGSSFPQEGINGRWSLNVGGYYPSGQTCTSW